MSITFKTVYNRRGGAASEVMLPAGAISSHSLNSSLPITTEGAQEVVAGAPLRGPWRDTNGKEVVLQGCASQPGTLYVETSNDGVIATSAAVGNPVPDERVCARFSTTETKYRITFAAAVNCKRVNLESQLRDVGA